MNKIVQMPGALSVYLAGKVTATTDEGGVRCEMVEEWRFFLTGWEQFKEHVTEEYLREAGFHTLEQKIEIDGELFWTNVSCPRWTYAGPFFEAQHGALIEESKDAIFKRNMESIRQCNMLFAYIDSIDCFGTLAEIGFAYALSKPVYIAFDHSMRRLVHDFWFVTHCAISTDVCRNRSQLVQLFNRALRCEEMRRGGVQMTAAE